MNRSEDIQIQTLTFEDDGKIPNNQDCALLIYKNAFTTKDQPREILKENNWSNAWRGGVFSYHHYHSNSHEVLVVDGGSGELHMGGESGSKIKIEFGDVLIIPAGVGHKLLNSSRDFAVIGAYPNGKSYDLCTENETNREHLRDNIKNVSLPDFDPVYGENGPLFEYWEEA